MSLARRLTGLSALVAIALAVAALQPWQRTVRHEGTPAFGRLPPQASTLLPRGFVELPDFMEGPALYRNDNGFAETFILRDGRLVHALKMGATTDASTMRRRVWVMVERLAAGARLPLPTAPPKSTVNWISHDSGRTQEIGGHAALSIPNAWPGIDLELRDTAAGIERIYTVKPGSVPESIEVTLDGAMNARVAPGGALEFDTGVGRVKFRRPVAYQLDENRQRRPVSARWRVLEEGRGYGFSIGAYDRGHDLVIDPVLQGTYFGTQGQESIFAMAIDPRNGEVVVGGRWNTGNLPEVTGGFQTLGQVIGIFVERMDAKLEKAIQGTMIGGALAEDLRAMALDPTTGDIYVGGATSSFDFAGGGGSDEPVIPLGTLGAAFVSRLSPDLRKLEQTTFFSAMQGSDFVWGLAVNAQTHEVYAVGTDVNGSAVVSRYNRELTQLLSRFAIQGNVSAAGRGIAINQATGDVYVTGITQSWDFPGLAGGAFSSTEHPNSFAYQRVFVARFDAQLSSLLQSSYLWNGLTWDMHADVFPVTVDPSTGNVYVAAASQGDLGTVGGAQPTFSGGNSDALVVGFAPDLRSSFGATYLGGSGDENSTGIAMALDGNSVYLAGFSDSNTLPGTSTSTSPFNYPFVAHFSTTLDTLYSTLIYPGGVDDTARTLAIHPVSGEVYFAGISAAGGFPFTTGGFQPEHAQNIPNGVGAHEDGFIARADPDLTQADDAIPDSFDFPTQSGVAAGGIVTSAPIRIRGYTVPLNISITGGSYSIDDGAFTSTDGTISPGQRVRVQHTASLLPGADTGSTLSIGGVGSTVSATFHTLTESGTSITPTPFMLPDLSPVAVGRRLLSPPVVIGGTDAPVPISVTGGRYSIDESPFTSDPGFVYAGQTVVVEQVSAATLSTTTDTVLSAGGSSVTFRSTTDAPDDVPHAFALGSFGPPMSQFSPDSLVESLPAVITDINVPVPVSVTGGEYRIGAGDWTTAPGMINNGDGVVVRLRTGSAGSTTTATLNVGGVTDTFSVAVPGTIPDSQQPDPFVLRPVNGATPFQWVESATVFLTGLTERTPIQIMDAANPPLLSSDGRWFSHDWQEFAFGGVLHGGPLGVNWFSPDQPLRVRVLAMNYDSTYRVLVDVGGVRAPFSITTKADGGSPTPRDFQFAAVTGAAPSSVVTSETITLGGLGVASTLTAVGCDVSITDGEFSSGGTVLNGDTVVARMTAPSGSGQSSDCTVTVGSYSTKLMVTTAGTPAGGGGGGGGSGGGGGAVGIESLVALSALLLGYRRRWRPLHDFRDPRSTQTTSRPATSRWASRHQASRALAGLRKHSISSVFAASDPSPPPPEVPTPASR